MLSTFVRKAVVSSLFLSSSLFAAVIITPDDSRLRYTGIVDSDINSTRAKLYRHVSGVRDVNGTGWQPAKAGNQAGVTIRFRTSSPNVKLTFEEDPNFEARWGMMALFRNGVRLTTKNTAPAANYEISATGQPNQTADWVFTFPGWQPMWLNSIELADGHDLEVLPEDSRPLYVAIGNSITHGVGQSGTATHLNYAYQTAESLGMDHVNLAIGGSSINLGMLQSLDSLKSQSGNIPDVISVLWGYNNVHYSGWAMSDILDDFTAVMDHLITHYPSSEIWVIGTPYSDNETGKNNMTLTELREGQDSVTQLKQSSHSALYYFDASTVITSTTQLSDGIHLNDQGASDLADGFTAAYNAIHESSSSSSNSGSSSSENTWIEHDAECDLADSSASSNCPPGEATQNPQKDWSIQQSGKEFEFVPQTSKTYKLQIYSLTGALLQTIETSKRARCGTHLKQGVYLLRVSSRSGVRTVYLHAH